MHGKGAQLYINKYTYKQAEQFFHINNNLVLNNTKLIVIY